MERSVLAMVIGLPVLAVYLWWWQARLDDWPQLAVVVGAVLVSIYAAYMVLIYWLVEVVAQILRRLID